MSNEMHVGLLAAALGVRLADPRGERRCSEWVKDGKVSRQCRNRAVGKKGFAWRCEQHGGEATNGKGA